MKHTNPVRTTQTILRRLMPALAVAVLLITLPVAQAGGKQAVIMQVSENDPLAWNLTLNIALESNGNFKGEHKCERFTG